VCYPISLGGVRGMPGFFTSPLPVSIFNHPDALLNKLRNYIIDG
jgi:hypothetical protein